MINNSFYYYYIIQSYKWLKYKSYFSSIQKSIKMFTFIQQYSHNNNFNENWKISFYTNETKIYLSQELNPRPLPRRSNAELSQTIAWCDILFYKTWHSWNELVNICNMKYANRLLLWDGTVGKYSHIKEKTSDLTHNLRHIFA